MRLAQKPHHLLVASLLLFTSFFFASCKKDDTALSTNTIADVITNNNDFTILRAAVVRANLTDALRTGSLTLFAPNDAAFKASGIPDVATVNALPIPTLTSILQYHILGTRVLSGSIPVALNTPQQTLLTTNGVVYVTKIGTAVSINGKRIVTADAAADNGVIHTIDGVLMPPTGDVVTTVLADPGSFSLLTAAVTRAGAAVVSALQSTTAATLFAPTNDAFVTSGFSASAIAAATPAQLTRILSYHVIPGRVFTPQLTDGLAVGTLLGAAPTLKFGVTGAGVTVLGAGNGTTTANVTQANILTTNAVIHKIDRVLLPGS